MTDQTISQLDAAQHSTAPGVTVRVGKAYWVRRYDTGITARCTYTRGVWNNVYTGRFFGYAHQVYVVGDA